MNIGIVTSFYNHYDRFFPQWALSLSELKTKPSAITVVVCGDLYEKENIDKGETILKQMGVPYQIIYMEFLGMGEGRNRAVAATNTEWIQYLDVDDVILPNAIDHYKKYQHLADVISGGLKIQGAKNQIILYDKLATREKAIRGGYVCCSHAVYKKKFWEMSPYITKNDYIEQSLWLGFAQHGAEFIGTKEVCTLYLSRQDGHNLTMTPEQKREARDQWLRFIKEGVK